MLFNLLYFCKYLLHFLLLFTFVKTKLFIKIIDFFHYHCFNFFLAISSHVLKCHRFLFLSFVFSFSFFFHLERCFPSEVLLAPYLAMLMYILPDSFWQVFLLSLPLNINGTPVVGESRSSFAHFALPTMVSYLAELQTTKFFGTYSSNLSSLTLCFYLCNVCT